MVVWQTNPSHLCTTRCPTTATRYPRGPAATVWRQSDRRSDIRATECHTEPVSRCGTFSKWARRSFARAQRRHAGAGTKAVVGRGLFMRARQERAKGGVRRVTTRSAIAEKKRAAPRSDLPGGGCGRTRVNIWVTSILGQLRGSCVFACARLITTDIPRHVSTELVRRTVMQVPCGRWFIGVATGLVVATLGTFAQEDQRPTFRVKVDMVVLSFTVTD